MAKTIKRNIDVIIITGIGLFLLVGAMMGVYERISVDYVSAATTADVVVTATVAQSAELTVSAVNSGVAINGSTTTVTTTADVAFGTLVAATNAIAAHTLTMTTNAGSGYTVNTTYNNKLWRTGATSSDIDDHAGTNGSPSAFPESTSDEDFGYTTEDFSLSVAGDGADRFTGGDWAGFTTGSSEIAYHDAPVNATTTKVGYQAGITGLTAAGTDYQCTVTHTMTPSF